MSQSREARERAAELKQLAGLIDSLGAADAPPALAQNVLTQISHRPHAVRPLTFQRGVTVNKKILFGLAAAAAIVLAVITYNSNPPATEGTEATIGAAQRAQAPQIAAKDVKLGDTSIQDVLQTETFDALVKDETLRTMLQDASLRVKLTEADFKKALSDDAIRIALRSPQLARHLQDEAMLRSLGSAEMTKKVADANMRALLSNRAFADALRQHELRQLISRHGAALASDKLLRAVRDANFDAAMRSQEFASRLAGRSSAQ